MSYLETTYLHRVLDPKSLNEQINIISRRLRKYKNDFDTIAIRGMSGALVGSAVAIKLGKGITIVRKKENRHSYRDVEGNKEHTRYVIIDDLIATGSTIEEIRENMTTFNNGVCVGIILYNQDDLNDENYIGRQAINWNCWITNTAKKQYTWDPAQ